MSALPGRILLSLIALTLANGCSRKLGTDASTNSSNSVRAEFSSSSDAHLTITEVARIAWNAVAERGVDPHEYGRFTMQYSPIRKGYWMAVFEQSSLATDSAFKVWISDITKTVDTIIPVQNPPSNPLAAHSVMPDTVSLAWDAAERRGFHPRGYSRCTVIFPAPYKNRWFIVFDGRSNVTGDFFAVSVDDETGATEIHLGA
jgi:hypothetical protein